MSNISKAEVTITFENDIEESFKKVEDWIWLANNRKLIGKFEGYYQILVEEKIHNQLFLYVESDRSQNLDWQLENLSFFVHDNVKDAVSFETIVWIMSDGPSWERSENTNEEE
jgi:hypothetical protein